VKKVVGMGLMLVMLVGCAGIDLAKEEEERILSLGQELEVLLAEIKLMKESGDYDPDKLLQMLARVNDIRKEVADIIAKAEDRGFDIWEWVGFLLTGALGYLGVGRPARLGVSALITKMRGSSEPDNA